MDSKQLAETNHLLMSIVTRDILIKEGLVTREGFKELLRKKINQMDFNEEDRAQMLENI